MLAAALLMLFSTAASDDALNLAYPGSRLLLESEVSGKEFRIRWRCYATRDALEKVAQLYESDPRLEKGTWRMTRQERGFQLKARPSLHVAVLPMEDLAQRTSCREAKLEPGEQTVLQISEGTRVPAGSGDQ